MYLQGEETAILDAEGNIYLDRDPTLYQLIFYWLRWSDNRLMVHNGLIQQLGGLIRESQFLKLEKLVTLLDMFVDTDRTPSRCIILRNKIKAMPVSNYTYLGSGGKPIKYLKDMVTRSKILMQDQQRCNVFIDITEEDCDLLLGSWNKTVVKNNKDEDANPVTKLARKLGIIANNEYIIIG